MMIRESIERRAIFPCEISHLLVYQRYLELQDMVAFRLIQTRRLVASVGRGYLKNITGSVPYEIHGS